MRLRKIVLVWAILAFQCIIVSSAFAALSEEEKTFLSMYFKPEELQVVSATRSLKSISRVAENVEVITAEDIELMNAHTVADVLPGINGIQAYLNGGPGTFFSSAIQGSQDYHIAFFVDGIPFNNLTDNMPDISYLPAQIIRKIEIIKGPASSSWGSSLGGVINIITKSSDERENNGNMLSAAYGKNNSGDFRAQVSGRKDKLGYYLYAGRLQSDGLTRNFDVAANNVYSKISYKLSDSTDMTFNLLYNNSKRGDGDDLASDIYYHNGFKYLLSGISINTVLTKGFHLDVAFKGIQRKGAYYLSQLSTGNELSKDNQKENEYLASVKLTYNHERHTVVLGSDYSSGDANADSFSEGKQRIKKTAIYANDTIIIGNFSLTPGLRYDDISITKTFLSPSFGITYNLTKTTMLRAFTARGFNSPWLGSTSANSTVTGHMANHGLDVEKITSYQLGGETSALKYLWLKISAFRHDITDTIVSEDITDPTYTWTNVNKGKQRRQGVEIDFRTLPYNDFMLLGGATFIEARDVETDTIIKDIPQYTYDISLRYENEKILRALLKGHYIWWNADPSRNAKYSAFIFDLNLIKEIYKDREKAVEIFLTVHNMFDGAQYLKDFYKNPDRWMEGGIRYKF